MRHNITKKKGKEIAQIVKKYFLNAYTKDIDAFNELEAILSNEEFSKKEITQLNRLFALFFLGQLVGLPTLNSILIKYGVSNGKHQRNYKKICKKLSPSTLKTIFESIFEQNIAIIFKKMSEKHPSDFSKNPITVILDDSVFKQWLKNCEKTRASFEGFYSRFFSGQCGKAVFGFRVVMLGVSVNQVFYPLYYELVKETSVKKVIVKPSKSTKSSKKEKISLAEKEAKKEKRIQEIALEKADKLLVASGKKVDSAISMAIKLVKRFGLWKRKLTQSGMVLPDFHLSCDSGYSNELLEQTCGHNDLKYISVVKKAHNFEIDGKQIKASSLIETVFLKKEAEHQAREAHLPKNGKTPFTQRIRAIYCCRNNKSVVLLIFRLNGSKKVSIIYTTHLEIMSKTLRRHWFARTYIEQFFKTLKHVLKIQQATTNTKDAFEVKLMRFCLTALHVQKLIMVIRKEVKTFQNKGFIALQRILNNERIIINLLQKYAK